MSDYKQSSIDRRDTRNTKIPEEEFRQRNKNKDVRPVVVESRWSEAAMRLPWLKSLMNEGELEWHKYKSYRNRKEAQEAMDRLTKKSDLMEYRIRPEDTSEN